MSGDDTLAAFVEIGRNVSDCERHGSDWCSCKVRQYLSLLADASLRVVRVEGDHIKHGDTMHRLSDDLFARRDPSQIHDGAR